MHITIDYPRWPERSDAYSRVWLDGKEVTTQCWMADDEAGEVGLYPRHADGLEPTRIIVKGHVRIEYGANAPSQSEEAETEERR